MTFHRVLAMVIPKLVSKVVQIEAVNFNQTAAAKLINFAETEDNQQLAVIQQLPEPFEKEHPGQSFRSIVKSG